MDIRTLAAELVEALRVPYLEPSERTVEALRRVTA
jgi:hypothetical protein